MRWPGVIQRTDRRAIDSLGHRHLVIAGIRLHAPMIRCRPVRDRRLVAGSWGPLTEHAPLTQETPATAYFPEGLPPEYLRRWRA